MVGLNQNHTSKSRTSYHVQIEDRGPVHDEAAGRDVRRVNLIVYANYGEPNARIVFGRNHDFEDVRTHEHNRFVAAQISALAAGARGVIEQFEQREIERIKGLVREYHRSKTKAAKKDLEAANATFPFLFSRAWVELKQERPPGADPAPGPEPDSALDAMLREQVGEIERIITLLGEDLRRLGAQGGTDDILLQTCRRLIRARRRGSPSADPPRSSPAAWT